MTRTTAGKSMTRTPTTHQAPADAGAFLLHSTTTLKEQKMTENINAETSPAEHEEAVCSGGGTLCHECRVAAADFGAE